MKEPITAIPRDANDNGGNIPQISVRGIAKSFGGLEAVQDVNLDIYSGEVLAIVGDNGAGKSTFIKMLSGVITPDSGNIMIQGRRVEINTPVDARSLGIETLYQELGLVDVFTVQENIFLGREIQYKRFGVIPALNHAEMRAQTEALLQRLDVRLPSLDRQVRSYSGGQRQAIAISRLLLAEVKLLIMDEPMAALGVDESNRVLNLISSMREKGLALIVISHNLDHVFSVADRIAVMKNGKLVGVVRAQETTHDDVVAMIVTGKAG